jgi:hypothetical protein
LHHHHPPFGAIIAALLIKTEQSCRKNSIVWSEQRDVTPTPDEVEAIANLLEGEHGIHAAEVAEFFATHHSLGGDAGRSWAWTGVADRIRDREQKRIVAARGW